MFEPVPTPWVDALEPMTTVIPMDQLMEASFQDGIPITNHQAREIENISRQVTESGGFYIMNNIVKNYEFTGTVFTFFNDKSEVVKLITLNFPHVAANRKIPKRSVVNAWFDYIGYNSERIERKIVHKLIDSHVRDGGTFERRNSDQHISITLLMNGQVKTRLEFFREDLSV